MRYIIVTASAARYNDTCKKLEEAANEKAEAGYVPHGSMNIVFDEHRAVWHASQPMFYE